MRWFLSYVISTGPVGDSSWRLRFTTVLALIGPGSVPFALLMFGTQHQLLLDADWEPGLSALFAALTGTAVVLARFRPVAAWTLIMVVFAASVLGTDAIGPGPWPMTSSGIFVYLVVQFALSRDCRVWVAIGAWFGYLAAGLGSLWALNAGTLDVDVLGPNPFVPVPAERTAASLAGENLGVMAVFGVLVFVVGLSVRIWRQGRARVAEEEKVATAERGRRRMLEERTRIARELHDIVAHHMSVITVQSSTAEYRIDGLSDAARQEFRSISEQARASLAEMRRLLAVLRKEDQERLHDPMPGPEGLAGLTEAVDRSGTPTTLTVVDLPEDLPETVGLTVYRVVQEALSNVVRHAAGAATEVEARREDGSLVVTVVNAARPDGGAPSVPDGSGLGLVGMRERVVIAGGELEAGPTEEGGFRVRAELPLDAGLDTQE